jgi:hypothetical protein
MRAERAGSGQRRQRWAPSRKLCLYLAAGWSLLGAGACVTTFYIASVPSVLLPGGKDVSSLAFFSATAVTAWIVPVCTLIPVPLLIAGRVYLLHATTGKSHWADVWTVLASAAVLLEAFFWVRLVRFLRRPEAGLTFSWHAADFAVGFLALGAIMVAALITASRSAGVDAGDGLAHRAPSS